MRQQHVPNIKTIKTNTLNNEKSNSMMIVLPQYILYTINSISYSLIMFSIMPCVVQLAIKLHIIEKKLPFYNIRKVNSSHYKIRSSSIMFLFQNL